MLVGRKYAGWMIALVMVLVSALELQGQTQVAANNWHRTCKPSAVVPGKSVIDELRVQSRWVGLPEGTYRIRMEVEGSQVLIIPGIGPVVIGHPWIPCDGNSVWNIGTNEGAVTLTGHPPAETSSAMFRVAIYRFGEAGLEEIAASVPTHIWCGDKMPALPIVVINTLE